MMNICQFGKTLAKLVQKIEYRRGFFVELSDLGDLEKYSRAPKCNNFLKVLQMVYMCHFWSKSGHWFKENALESMKLVLY